MLTEIFDLGEKRLEVSSRELEGFFNKKGTLKNCGIKFAFLGGDMMKYTDLSVYTDAMTSS